MRILKILSQDDKGGILTCEKQFIKYWNSQSIDVDILLVGKELPSQFLESEINNLYKIQKLDATYGGNLVEVIRGISDSITHSKESIKRIEFNNRYDAIIYRNPTYIHIAGELSKKFGVRSFWHMPNVVSNRLGKAYYNFFLRKYKIIPVANSKYTQSTLGKICKHVIYPGFNDNRIKKTDVSFRDDLLIPKDAHVFGTASRICYPKAQDLFINGIIESGLLEKNVHCLVAGGPMDSSYAKSLKKISSKFLNKVHFLGEINDLSKFYSSIDIYVNSRRDAEPFGISIVEAMGAGLPVIAYYEGGPKETVIENKNGWLIRDASVKAYSKAFKKVFDKKEEWREMGSYSRQNSNKFRADTNADKFLKIIRNYNE